MKHKTITVYLLIQGSPLIVNFIFNLNLPTLILWAPTAFTIIVILLTTSWFIVISAINYILTRK